MTDYNCLISSEGRSLLRALCGRTLESIEGYRCDFALSEDKTTFYSVARLHMADGDAYDLRVELVRVDITGETWDDVGKYSFERAEGGIWLPEGVKAFKLNVQRRIERVVLANDFDELFHAGLKTRSFAFTRAVLFQSGLEYLSLSVDDFSEDAIVVQRGFDLKELVPDGSGSWYDEPGWTDNYSRMFELP